jgi:1-acyl-sn-glycerol-3-phosphate acyltransferase
MNVESPPAAHPSSRLQAAWFEVIYATCMATMTLGFSLRIFGQKHMPQRGPALVISNHQSFLDPIVVGLAARRQLVPLARKTLFRNRFFGALIRSLKAVPIDQDGIGKEGIRAIAEQLQYGRAVMVFPEGSRTPDGAMHEFRPGIHLLLKRAPAPIVPVGIAGAYDAWPVWRPYPIPVPLCPAGGRAAVTVVVGKPLDPRPYAEMPREKAMQELFVQVHRLYEEAEQARHRQEYREKCS